MNSAVMVFRRAIALRPVNSRKNIVDQAGILPAITNTVLDNIINGVDQADLATVDEVTTGSRVNGFFMSFFAIGEGGEIANEVPLVDWYIIKDSGGAFGTTFDATHLPTPGTTSVHVNKRWIIHEEKGLTGGGDASLSGVPMIFKGVIAIPRHMRRIAVGDRFRLCVRATFATKNCTKFIYKWYS